MGIRNLTKFLRSKNIVKTTSIQSFKGYVIGIDALNYLHKYIKSSDRWLENLISFVCYFKQLYIKSVFIFDGETVTDKEPEWKRRQVQRDYLEKRLLIVEDEKKESIIQQLTQVTKQDIDKFKTVLNILGVPFVVAKGEAEVLASSLCKSGKIDAVLSEDSDCFALKCPLTLFGLDRSKNSVDYLEYSEITRELNFTHNEFIDMCILFGCDYNDHIKQIGPIRAYNLIREYKNIENIKSNTSSLKKLKCKLHFNGVSDELDTTELKYQLCRKKFMYNEDSDVPLNKQLDVTKLQEFISVNNLRISVDYVVKAFDIVKYE